MAPIAKEIGCPDILMAVGHLVQRRRHQNLIEEFPRHSDSQSGGRAGCSGIRKADTLAKLANACRAIRQGIYSSGTRVLTELVSDLPIDEQMMSTCAAPGFWRVRLCRR